MDIKSRYKTVEEAGLSVMQDVFSPILNREVQLTIKSINPADLNTLKTAFPDEVVIIDASVEGAIDGSLHYLFTKKLAAAITDLMVMGDGSAPFNEQESIDGIAEAVNQVVGALSTYWSDQLGESVRPKGAEAKLLSWDQFNLALEDYVQVDYGISIADWGEEQYTRLTPVSVFDALTRMPVQAAEARAPATDFMDAGTRGFGTQGGAEPTVRPATFAPFSEGDDKVVPSPEDIRNLDLLLDVSLPVTIELGRTTMLIRDVLEIGPGSVIELQKLSGEPIDLYVNDKKFALGEVVVIDENFGIRITELLKLEDRLKALR